MKLTNDLKQKLEYASTVHPSLYIREGNIVRARSQNRACLVKMKIDQQFPTEFMLYDVKNFLNASALLTDSDIKFVGDKNDGYMEMTNNVATIRYGFSAPELYTAYPDDKDFVPATVGWKFNLKLDETEFSNIMKASKVMNLDTVSFTESGIKMKNSTINSDRIPFEIKYNNLPKSSNDIPEKFSVDFSTDYFNLYSGSYDMELFKMGTVFVAKFDRVPEENKESDVTIWLSALPTSKG